MLHSSLGSNVTRYQHKNRHPSCFLNINPYIKFRTSFHALFYILPYFCEDKIELGVCLCFETANFQAVQQSKLMKGHTNILDMCHTAG